MRAEAIQRWGDRIERGEARSVAMRGFQRDAREHSRERSARADGLVIASYLSVRHAGRLLQLHLPGSQPEPEKRGKCDGMSEASRRRLLVMLHSLRRDAALPTMVTLTFPEELKVTPAEAKKCRLAWEKRVIRRHPAWCAVWRLEAHPEMSSRLGRVHPHFHLLTWGAFYDLSWVSQTWQEVVWKVLSVDKGLTDVAEKHRAAGTSCEKVRKWEGVLYCAKSYLAKEEEYPLGEAGRVWGYSNRDALPLAEEIRIPLTSQQACVVRLNVERWMAASKIVSDNLICTFFESDPWAFAQALLNRSGAPALSP